MPVDKTRILVVDDDEGNATLLTRLLEHAGHEVRMACDGLEAIETARQYLPQVVLLDIGLPGMNGFEVARRLRESDSEPQALLVAVSGYEKQDNEGPDAEVFDQWLVKPVRLATLQTVIETVLGLR